MNDEKQTELVKEQHKDLNTALSAFQGELKPIEKDGVVKFTTKDGKTVDFRYSTLGKVMEVIYPILGKHGLSVRWSLIEKGLECIVTHETGGRETSGILLLDMTKPDMKDVGAQITYGRRYTLGLVLGIATEEDKDAEMQDKNNVASKKLAVDMVESKIKNAKTVEVLDETIVFIQGHLDQAKKFEQGLVGEPSKLGLQVSEYEDLLKKAENKKLLILTDKKND